MSGFTRPAVPCGLAGTSDMLRLGKDPPTLTVNGGSRLWTA